jgi:hypothetical protein
VAQIAAHSQAGDAVAYAGGAGAYRTRIALAYHWRGPNRPRDIFVTRPAVDVGRFAAEECPNAELCLPPDVSRLWLMTSAPREQLFGGMPWRRAELLQREFRVAAVSAHGKLLLTLLVRDDPARRARPN